MPHKSQLDCVLARKKEKRGIFTDYHSISSLGFAPELHSAQTLNRTAHIYPAFLDAVIFWFF
tara:strand:+ start:569 stop:754 length:186 start_codon:yes stop_codon:yes gene_type:complete